MSVYEFSCPSCKIVWEKSAPMSRAPGKAKCPECKVMRERYFGTPTPVIFKGTGYRAPVRDAIKSRTNKQDLNEWYDSETKLANERLGSGGDMYRKYVIDSKSALKKGDIKQVSVEKYNERVKKVRKVREEVSNMQKRK